MSTAKVLRNYAAALLWYSQCYRLDNIVGGGLYDSMVSAVMGSQKGTAIKNLYKWEV